MNKTNSSVGVLRWMVLMSLAQGVFISYFFVFVNALFIKEIGTSQLPMAYILSGIGGFLITWLFNWLEKKWGFINSAILFCTFFAIVMFSIWYLYVQQLYLYQLIFFSYGWFWISINFTTLVFWKLPSNLFNISENKKYNGVISSGEVISAIIAYLSIPALLHQNLITRDKLLLISFIGIMIFSIITFILGRKIRKKEIQKSPFEISEEESSRSLFKENFFRLIFISVFVGVVIQLLIDFSLMEVSAFQFSEPEELAKYFAFLFGGMRLFELLLKTFLSKFIVKEYGVFISLTSIVFALSFLLIIGLSSLISGYLGLIIIVSSLSKVFERALYRSVYAPTINILYQAYPIKKRAITQNFADGFGKTLGQIFAALIILLINYVSNFEIKIFTLFLCSIVFLIFWYFISKNLIIAYKAKLYEMVKNLPNHFKIKNEDTPLQNIQTKYSAKDHHELFTLLLNMEWVNLNRENPEFKNTETNVEVIQDIHFVTELFYHQLTQLKQDQIERFGEYLQQLNLNHSSKIKKVVDLLVQTLILQKEAAFSFYSFNKKLRAKNFLTSSLIQNFKIEQTNFISKKDYLFLIEDRLQKHTYLLACKKDLAKSNELLLELIEREITSTKNDLIFSLRFKYEEKMVGEIYLMLTQNEKTQELVALELLELILNAQEKKWLMPIFREESGDKVLTKLLAEFPQVVLGKEKRLLSMIGNYKIDIPNILRNQALIELLTSFPKKEHYDLLKVFYVSHDLFIKKSIAYLIQKHKNEDFDAIFDELENNHELETFYNNQQYEIEQMINNEKKSATHDYLLNDNKNLMPIGEKNEAFIKAHEFLYQKVFPLEKSGA